MFEHVRMQYAHAQSVRDFLLWGRVLCTCTVASPDIELTSESQSGKGPMYGGARPVRKEESS